MDQPVIQPHIMGDRIAIKSELAHLQGQTKLADKVNLPIFNQHIDKRSLTTKHGLRFGMQGRITVNPIVNLVDAPCRCFGPDKPVPKRHRLEIQSRIISLNVQDFAVGANPLQGLSIDRADA